MRKLRHILVVVDPTADVQHCVEKAANLARASGAVLDLFLCDYQSSQLFTNRLPRDVIDAALNDRRSQLHGWLGAIAEPWRRQGLQVIAKCSFRDHLHSAVVEKVRTSGADLVVKDTHFHGVLRRALFTISDWQLIRECPVPLLLTKPASWNAPLRLAAAIDPGHDHDKHFTLDRTLLDMTAMLGQAMAGEVLAVHAFDPWLVANKLSISNVLAKLSRNDLEHVKSKRKLRQDVFNAVVAGHSAFQGRGDLIVGAPVPALTSYAARRAVDILVTGAVSRSPLRSMMEGSTAERLLDRLPCDIMVVKQEGTACGAPPAIPVQKVP